MNSASMPTRSSVRSRGRLAISSSITGMQSLRDCIEVSGGTVSFAQCRQAGGRPRRNKLNALRKDAKNLRASIINALAVPVGTRSTTRPAYRMLLNGVDADMLTATSDYFRRLLRNLDRHDRAGRTARGQRTQDSPRPVLE